MHPSASLGSKNLKKRVQNGLKLESGPSTFITFGVSNGTKLGPGSRAFGLN